MGRRVGVWHWFDNKTGVLVFEESRIDANRKIIVSNGGNSYMPHNRSYVKSYSVNRGYILWEGTILFNESFQEDTGVKHGFWRYYNESGTVIKTEEFDGGVRTDGIP
ncbi:MAG: hypothetical protein Roseis2KO_35900 [Roseivirga sp.]